MSKPLSFSQTRVVLASYTPSALDPAQWSSLRRSVIDTVAKARPTSVGHATQLAASLTGFLAFQPDLASKTVGELLSEGRVALWERANVDTYTENTRRRMAGQLRRLVRAGSGEPVSERSGEGSGRGRDRGLEPMNPDELFEVTGGDPAGWLDRCAGQWTDDRRRVRLVLDVQTLTERGVVAAVRAGMGPNRLEAAARFVPVPGDVVPILRGV